MCLGFPWKGNKWELMGNMQMYANDEIAQTPGGRLKLFGMRGPGKRRRVMGRMERGADPFRHQEVPPPHWFDRREPSVAVIHFLQPQSDRKWDYGHRRAPSAGRLWGSSRMMVKSQDVADWTIRS